MPTPRREGDPLELREYLHLLRAHWIGIVLFTLLGLGVALGWTILQPRVYTATASGYVTASDLAAGEAGSSLVGDQLARSKVTSYLDIGSWRVVAESAIDELSLATTPEALVTKVSVANPLDTVVIHVSATASSPESARDLAEAWIRGMTAAIDEIEGDGTPGSAPVTLVPGDSARLPSSPSSPNLMLNVALGGVIGLALGVGYAVIRSVLDRRIRNADDIERETGASVVGTLPLERGLDTRREVLSFSTQQTAPQRFALTEALRELRANLQFMDVDHPPRSIVVTSPFAGDGKSTTAANLAMSLAAAGERVALVDADLRRPTMASLFRLPEGAGLTDVLTGKAAIQDVAYTIGESRNLLVLTAGRIPPNPSEVLGSQRMRDLITTLTTHGLVIIDSPPTLLVSDAAVLTAACDGALVIVSSGRTTIETLQKSLHNLEKVHGRVLGVVLNKAPRRHGRNDAYYSYSAQEPPPERDATVADVERTRAG
jgi:capsular exopolysaccharide synthesis family protein